MNYVFSDCELDTCLYTLQRAGKTIRLRPKVFRVCLYLLEHRDRVVSREELCNQIWAGQFISQATIEGAIRAVRQAVGDSGQAQSIVETLHRYGYRFVADVRERPTGVAERLIPPASATLTAQGASSLRQTADVTVPGVSAPDLDAKLAPLWPGDAGLGTAFDEGYRTERCDDIASGEQRIGSSRSAVGLPRSHLLMALAVLLLSLLGGWGLWHMVREGEGVAVDRSRIAVLPFLNLSAEADRADIADGMTEELIAQLSQIHGLT